jgi:hypothetical protein
VAKTRDNYQVTGGTVPEVVRSLNFLLQRIADRLDRAEGIRGTASIESDLDMNQNVVFDLAGGQDEADSARRADLEEVEAYTVTAGAGLTGGGAIASNPSFAVGAGTGITVSADAVGLTDMAAATLKGRALGAGTGVPTDLSAAQVKAILALATSDLSDVATWANFTPTVTLVGGAGNTVPVYSTNQGRWMRLGKTVWVDVYLTGDGGNEGAGTGRVNVALPVAVGANAVPDYKVVGRFSNNALRGLVIGELPASATTIALAYFDTIGTIAVITGDLQNNATRLIKLSFHYETD